MKKMKVTLLTMGMIIGISATAFAISEQIQTVTAQLHPEYSVKVEGKEQILTSATGDVVHPLLHNGTTYLPVRAIGELMGKDVVWDKETKSIDLTTKLQEEPIEIIAMTVDDIEQLAEKGEALEWSDFAPYKGEDIGSGLIVFKYPVEGRMFIQEGDGLFVEVGGPNLEEKPTYIHLVHKHTGNKVDLGKGDLFELSEFWDKLIMDNYMAMSAGKPIIYLYPEETTDISVDLEYNGDVFVTYPEYHNGWEVTAEPDGTLTNKIDGKEYSYLFWEGITDVAYDMSKGFVVKGEDTAEFLQEKLSYMGLSSKEYNEFIVYWLPQMIGNPYNLITFQEDIYTENAVLEIQPQPDSIQRVFMAFQGLDKKIEIEEPKIQAFERSGFTVIEWGGTEIFE